MFYQNIHYIQLLVPALCSGSLFVGIVFFLYIYHRDRKSVYLALVCLMLSAFIFVSSELMLLISASMLADVSLGMQFHRIEQLSGALFIPFLVNFLHSYLDLTPRLRSINLILRQCGALMAVVIIIAAFVYPDSFISQTLHTDKWMNHAGDMGRGREGFLYYFRDGILGLLICYSVFCFIYEIKKYKGFRYNILPLIGIIFAFIGAVDDTIYVHFNRFSGILGQTYYSKFSLGLTLFMMFSMAGSIRRFVDQAKEVEAAYSRVNSAFRALNNSQQRFRQLAENINEVFLLYDTLNSVFLYISPAFERVWGYPSSLLIDDPNYWLKQVLPEDMAEAEKAIAPDLRQNSLELEYRVQREDGIRWLRDQLFFIRDMHGKVYRIARIQEDVTERKLSENELAYLAYHDILTGLPNRRSFYERFHDLLKQAGREGSVRTRAAFFIDLDKFKSINDSYGHSFGDKVLRQVATRLKSCLRQSDYIFRFSGDEFTVILTSISHDEDAATVAMKIIKSVIEPYDIEDKEVYIGLSIGISLFPRDGDDPEVLIKNADIALYEAKNQGNTYRFFNDDMNRRALEKITIENDLRHATDKDQLAMHYQPIMDPEGKLVACESLIRWDHPELGFISPERFIPVAESSGLILPLGEWILNTVFSQAAQWQNNGSFFRIGINLSARQFTDEKLLSVIDALVKKSGIDPEYVEFEITESSIMDNPDLCSDVIDSLRARGFGIAIDDFGTGYSSLSYLQRFRITHLKVDKSFIDNLEFDENNREITRTIIELAHNLKMRVIAEGVEDDRQFSLLRYLGCDEYQGYMFSKPLCVDDFNSYIQSNKVIERPRD